MKSKLFLLAALIVFTQSVSAQNERVKPFKFGIGFTSGFGLPTSYNDSSLGIGLDIQGEYAILPSLAITLSTGYLAFLYSLAGDSSDIGSDLKAGSIPILTGVRYYHRKFFAGAQLGVSLMSTGENLLTFAPSVGIKFSRHFDLSLKYQTTIDTKYYDSVPFLGIRAGITF